MDFTIIVCMMIESSVFEIEIGAAKRILGDSMKATFVLVGTGTLFCVIAAYAQQSPSQKPAISSTDSTAAINFSAKSSNVGQPGTPLRINLIRWSTEEERLPILAALN